LYLWLAVLPCGYRTGDWNGQQQRRRQAALRHRPGDERRVRPGSRGPTASNPLTCVDRAAYLHDMFLASDTTVALLSDLPSTHESNDPLPFSDAEETRQLARSLTHGGSSRLLLQNVVAPNFGSLRRRLDGMTAAAETGRLSAFKVYTAWGPHGRGFHLDNPAVGLPVYHSGWTPQHTEGPYNPADPVGVDSLIKALDRYHVPPDSNVWADLATVWRSLLARPEQAAHVLGKLLSRLGEDRLRWGTDRVWYGPPQTQIMAFRAFEISAEFQERYGYPALTRAIKAKVLGLNAARLWGLDLDGTKCALAADGLDSARPGARELAEAGELPALRVPRGAVTRGEILHWRAGEAGPWIPV
jgi:hypothetical protein